MKKATKVLAKWTKVLAKWTKKLFSILVAPFVMFWNLIKSTMRKKPLFKKVLYTLALLLIFRIGATITIPSVKVDTDLGGDQGGLLNIMDMMGGGALKRFSIFALGISPYITTSIIMTLLKSEAFPPLYRLANSGPAGKRKINIITRVLTLVFAFFQAILVVRTVGQASYIHFANGYDTFWFEWIALPIILISGSLFALFLGEQITNNGVGNGTSLIIFSGIAASLPAKIESAYKAFAGSGQEGSYFVGLMNFSMYMGVFIFLIFVIGYFYKAERHIPIQQTGSGMTQDVKQMSRLPIKLNPAGVMPVMFAITIALIPLQIANMMDKQNLIGIWINKNMKLTAPIGLSLLVGVNFLFTIVMALVTFQPNQVADNFKKNGTFVPGLRPGQETEDYLTGTIIRLGVFSAIYLSLVVIIQYIEQIIGVEQTVTLSGMSIIILVSVGIETIGQLKARDKTQKISKAKIKSIQKRDGTKTTSTGGLLW